MWSVSNYEGQYAFGASGVLTNAMFELCRAVNERQHALDIVVTQFKDKDGNLASDLELDDFVGMFVTGENNHFRYNCTQIMNWIRVAVAAGWFMEAPSASSVQWTAASMMTDIGLGSSWLSSFTPYYPSNVCDYIFYQRCKEALDRMTYVVARNRYNGTGTMTITGSESDTGYADFATAWSNRYDFPYPPTTSGRDPELWMGGYFPGSGSPFPQVGTMTYLLTPYSKDEYVLGTSSGAIGSSTLTGSIEESYVWAGRRQTIFGPTGRYVNFGDWTVDGTLATIPSSSLTQFVLHEIGSASLTSNFSIASVLDEPSGFSAGTSFGDYTILSYVQVYVDISSELSDQT